MFLKRRSLDLKSEIINLRIKEGPWKNAFKGGRNEAGFRYYFVSDALRAIARDPDVSDVIDAYLSHVLERADSKGLWEDVSDVRKSTPMLADADDSNAAQLILLAASYYQTLNGKIWWSKKTHGVKNGDALKAIAQKVLLDNRLPSGLVTVFSKTRDFNQIKVDSPRKPEESPEEYAKRLDDIRAFRIAIQKDAYTMDSCEVYSSLSALSHVLLEEQDPQVLDFARAAKGVARGIAELYHEKAGAFYTLAGEKKALTPNFYQEASIVFYSKRAAQVYPELFQVPLSEDPIKTKQMYDTAWKFATSSHGPDKKSDWDIGFPAADIFPWMVRGYMALKRGNLILAQQYLDWFLEEVDKPDNHGFRRIHEVAYALRLQRGLAIRNLK